MDTFLAYWAEDGDDSLDTFETEQEAVDCLEEWIERRRDDAADEGWPLGMRGYVARLTHRVQEFKTDAPEGSSFESCCDYAVKSLPDAQAARIAALEGEVLRLNEALNSIKLDRESSDVTWCPQCGPHVIVDDEGLCEMCGATSVGAGAARAVALSEENAALEGRLRETCQILVESVGGLGPCNAEDAARRAAEVVDQLRAQLAAPLRLGRGPTVEEIARHYERGGLWLCRLNEWEEVNCGENLWRERWLHPGLAEDVVNKALIPDCIPLSSSRQPCGVGVKL